MFYRPPAPPEPATEAKNTQQIGFLDLVNALETIAPDRRQAQELLDDIHVSPVLSTYLSLLQEKKTSERPADIDIPKGDDIQTVLSQTDTLLHVAKQVRERYENNELTVTIKQLIPELSHISCTRSENTGQQYVANEAGKLIGSLCKLASFNKNITDIEHGGTTALDDKAVKLTGPDLRTALLCTPDAFQGVRKQCCDLYGVQELPVAPSERGKERAQGPAHQI